MQLQIITKLLMGNLQRQNKHRAVTKVLDVQYMLLSDNASNMKKVVGFVMCDKSTVGTLTWFLDPIQKLTSRLESEKITTVYHVVSNSVGIEHHLHSSPKPPFQPFLEAYQSKQLHLWPSTLLL